MATRATASACTIWEDNSVTLLARLRGASGAYILQADFSSIAASVWLSHVPATPTLSAAALTVANVVFDTLQTSDARWTKDTTGFNFAYTVPASAFPSPGAHVIEITFTPSSGDPWTYKRDVTAKNLFTS